MKFDFNSSTFPDTWFSPQGKEYWKDVKFDFIQKYGDDDHEVTNVIVKEIGVNHDVSELITGYGFNLAEEVYKSEILSRKICVYSDMRVSPSGIVSLVLRQKEAKIRYVTTQQKYTSHEFDKIVNLWVSIEYQIFSHCKIKPEDVTEEKAIPIIEELKNFEIQTG